MLYGLRCYSVPAVVALLASFCAHAAVFPRVTLDDLVSRSEVIVQAEVGRSWSAWDDKHRYIWTHYQLNVTDSVRGAGSTVVVSEPGGVVDGVEQQFDGVLSWKPGDNVLVFLYRTPIGYLRTTGGPQGRFMIGADKRIQLETRSGEWGSGVSGQKTQLRALAGMPIDRVKARLRAMSRELPLGK